MNFVNYTQFIENIKEWAKRLPKDFDLIVGIPRSGLLPALVLSLYFNIPLTTADLFLNKGQMIKGGTREKFRKSFLLKFLFRKPKLFIVDDSVCSGKEMKKVKDFFKNKKNLKIKYGAVYISPGKEKIVDYYFKKVNHPRFFEWNIMYHRDHLSNSCMDIDGILCENPNEEENDDGEKYLKFLSSVKPLYQPTVKIKYLVTSRLEKYRKETENWLSKYDIKYNQLIMMNLLDKKARLQSKSHAKFKAEFYQKSGCILFIESSKEQAQKISKLTKKPVLCFENMELY